MLAPDFPFDITHVAEGTTHDGTPRLTVYLEDDDGRVYHVRFKKVEAISVGITITDDTDLSGPYWDLNGWGGPGYDDGTQKYALVGTAIRYLAKFRDINVIETSHGGDRSEKEPDYTYDERAGGKVHLFAKGENTSLCGQVEVMTPRPFEGKGPDFQDHKLPTYRICNRCQTSYENREGDNE